MGRRDEVEVKRIKNVNTIILRDTAHGFTIPPILLLRKIRNLCKYDHFVRITTSKKQKNPINANIMI